MGFIATAIALGAVGSAASNIIGSQKTASANKNAAQEATQQNNAAIQAAKDAQATSGDQAAAQVKARVSGASQTVYTSPLGLANDATTIKKNLLGE